MIRELLKKILYGLKLCILKMYSSYKHLFIIVLLMETIILTILREIYYWRPYIVYTLSIFVINKNLIAVLNLLDEIHWYCLEDSYDSVFTLWYYMYINIYILQNTLYIVHKNRCFSGKHFIIWYYIVIIWYYIFIDII